MPTVYDWLLLAILVVGLGARAWFGMRALRRLDTERAATGRRRLWLRAMATQWGLVALLVVLWLARGRPFVSLGLGAPAPWGLAGVLAGLAFVVAVLAGQRRQLATKPELVERVRERLEPVAKLMPHERDEMPGFVWLCVTAGVCEEILFRGFATWLFAGVLPAFWMAAVAQAVLFGIAHTYQGPRGVVATGAVGLFLSGIVWVTGSLWAAMLVHALMDVHAGDLALRVYAGPRTPAGA